MMRVYKETGPFWSYHRYRNLQHLPPISVPDPDSGVFWIRIQGLKKRSKMLNFPTLSFNLLLLIRKYYNFEIVLYLYSDSVKKQPGSGSGLRFVAGSGSKFNQYRSETLPPIAFKRLAPILVPSQVGTVPTPLRDWTLLVPLQVGTVPLFTHCRNKSLAPILVPSHVGTLQPLSHCC